MAPIVKKKRTFLTIEQKKEILNKLNSGKSFRQLAAEFNVGKSTISNIKLNGLKIDIYITKAENGMGRRKTMRSAEYQLMEKRLYNWYVNRRQHNAQISWRSLKKRPNYSVPKFMEQMLNLWLVTVEWLNDDTDFIDDVIEDDGIEYSDHNENENQEPII